MQLHSLCLKTSNDVCPWLLTGLINVVSSISYSTLYICNHIFFFLLKCNYTRYATIFFFSLESFQMQLWWTLHNVNNQRQPYHEKKNKLKKTPHKIISSSFYPWPSDTITSEIKLSIKQDGAVILNLLSIRLFFPPVMIYTKHIRL